MNRPSNVAAVLCIAGPTLRRSFELPVKRARSFDRRSNVPGLLICSAILDPLVKLQKCVVRIMIFSHNAAVWMLMFHKLILLALN